MTSPLFIAAIDQGTTGLQWLLDNVPGLRANWQAARVFEPQWDEARRAEGYAGWQKAVERAKGWLE